ncbi:MaoC family dehydratase [Streptomyces boninensis]|uniref:MaoC family dehydratase n=1 Tax=Streptomyces boninensis TaxID=2039455 RepID=UPI003B217EFD
MQRPDAMVQTPAPRLPVLYAKALLPKGRGGAGGAVPVRGLVRTGIAADKRRLLRYAQVCGFKPGEQLPVTYPHIVAFPMSMQLMTARDFPFPMLGLVHIRNRIEQLRPIAADERLRYEVWVNEPYEHPKGAAFEVAAQCTTTAGEVVWREVSTYLSRGGRGGGAKGPALAAAPERDDGWSTSQWEIPGNTGRSYAAVSGDRNPIHLSPLTAKLFGFPKAIAHGMWSKARSLAELGDRLPDAYAVDVSFKAPILLPASVAFSSGPVRDGGLGFRLESRGREHLWGSVGEV